MAGLDPVFGAIFDASLSIWNLHPVGRISDRAKAITLCDDCLSSRIFTGPWLQARVIQQSGENGLSHIELYDDT